MGGRRAALSRALTSRGDVVVDLRALTFADPSLIVDLAMLGRRLRKSGLRLHLRGAQPAVARLIEQAGLHRVAGIVVDGLAPAPLLA